MSCRSGSPMRRALKARRLLLMAHPRAQPAEVLVELDQWVRGGGQLLLLADPRLDWHSERPLGDRLRPPPAFADTGLLGHWGLRLERAAPPTGPPRSAMAGYRFSHPRRVVWKPGQLRNRGAGVCRALPDRPGRGDGHRRRRFPERRRRGSARRADRAQPRPADRRTGPAGNPLGGASHAPLANKLIHRVANQEQA